MSIGMKLVSGAVGMALLILMGGAVGYMDEDDGMLLAGVGGPGSPGWGAFHES